MEKITITFEGKSVRQIAGRLALILSGKDKREKISKSVFFEALASHYNFTNEKTLFYWDICKQFEEDFYGEVLEFLLEQETTPGTPKIKAFLLEVGNIEIPNSPDDENNNDNTGKVRDAHEYEDLPLPPMSIPEDGTLPDIRRIAQALSGDLMNAHTVSLLQLKEKAVKYLNERNKARSNGFIETEESLSQEMIRNGMTNGQSSFCDQYEFILRKCWNFSSESADLFNGFINQVSKELSFRYRFGSDAEDSMQNGVIDRAPDIDKWFSECNKWSNGFVFKITPGEDMKELCNFLYTIGYRFGEKKYGEKVRVPEDIHGYRGTIGIKLGGCATRSGLDWSQIEYYEKQGMEGIPLSVVRQKWNEWKKGHPGWEKYAANYWNGWDKNGDKPESRAVSKEKKNENNSLLSNFSTMNTTNISEKLGAHLETNVIYERLKKQGIQTFTLDKKAITAITGKKMDIAKDIEMLVIGKKGSPLEIFIGVDVLELIKNKSFSFSNGVEFVQDLNDIELDHEGLRTLISENSGEKEFIKFSETFGEYDGEYGNDVSVHVFEKLSDLQDTLSYNYGLFIPSDIGKPEIAIGQVIAVRDPAENCVKYGTVGGIKFLSQTAKYSFWTSVHNGWLNIGENNFGNSYIDTLDKTEKEYFS